MSMSDRIEIEVIEARNLMAMDLNGKSDPYCVVQLGAETRKTKIVNETLDPYWNETFSLPIVDGTVESIVIKLFDKDFAKDDELGYVEIPLARIKGEADLWCPIQPNRPKQRVSGDLHLKIRSLRRKSVQEAVSNAALIAVPKKDGGKPDLVIDEIGPPREPAGTEVLVAIKSVGLAADDIAIASQGVWGRTRLAKRLIMGHECAGEVLEVGPEVTNLKRGDRVAVEAQIPCMVCLRCKAGLTHLCGPNSYFLGITKNGALSKFLLHDSLLCHKLPDSVPFEHGALVDTLSHALHACRKAGLYPAATIAIFGCSPVGVTIMLLAKIFGVGRCLMIDVRKDRVEYAKQNGAIDAFLWDAGTGEESLATHLKKINGQELDTAFDTTASDGALRAGLLSLKPNGVMCVVGPHQPDALIPINHVAVREIDIRFATRYNDTYRTCIDLLASKKLQVSSMVSHRYKLSQAREALDRIMLNHPIHKAMIEV